MFRSGPHLLVVAGTLAIEQNPHEDDRDKQNHYADSQYEGAGKTQQQGHESTAPRQEHLLRGGAGNQPSHGEYQDKKPHLKNTHSKQTRNVRGKERDSAVAPDIAHDPHNQGKDTKQDDVQPPSPA